MSKAFNDDEVQRHIDRFVRTLPAEAEIWVSDAFDRIGSRIQADYYRFMGGPPIPRVLTARSTDHIRSYAAQGGARPGGTGASEQIRRIRSDRWITTGIFGSKVPYARIHELGGRYMHPNLFGRGIRAMIDMPARSHLRPAAKDEQPRIRKEMPKKFAEHWENSSR